MKATRSTEVSWKISADAYLLYSRLRCWRKTLQDLNFLLSFDDVAAQARGAEELA